MPQLTEYTALLKIRVFKLGGAYTLTIESGAKKAPKSYTFQGDHDAFVRFLMAIQAKDNKTWPRSVRGERYSDIANGVDSGEDSIIYVWEHDYMRYLNRAKKENTVRESVMDIDDFYDYISNSPKWEVFDDRPDVISFSYKGKIFIDFDKDEKGNPDNVGIKMSNNVGDIDIEFYYYGVKKVDVTPGLITFSNKLGDEINIFLR